MAIYREGYKFVEDILRNERRIFVDACDMGVGVKKGDPLWNSMKYVVRAYANEWHGESDEPTKNPVIRTKDSCSTTFTLMDEWAVSDGRKTAEQATEKFRVTYQSFKPWRAKPYLYPDFADMDGFISLEKL